VRVYSVHASHVQYSVKLVYANISLYAYIYNYALSRIGVSWVIVSNSEHNPFNTEWFRRLKMLNPELSMEHFSLSNSMLTCDCSIPWDSHKVSNMKYIMSYKCLGSSLSRAVAKAGISNSNCSVGHMKTYKVTRGPHYDADAEIAVPELLETAFTSYFLRKASWITDRSFPAISTFLVILSSRLRNLFTS